MFKRISILTFIVLSVLAVAALAPVNAAASVTAQDTVVPGPTIIVPTVLSTVVVPVTGQPAGIPLSTLLIIGLLVVLGFAIIVGGMAMNRAPHDDVHHDHH